MQINDVLIQSAEELYIQPSKTASIMKAICKIGGPGILSRENFEICPPRMHFLHSGAQIRVFEQNTNIVAAGLICRLQVAGRGLRVIVSPVRGVS